MKSHNIITLIMVFSLIPFFGNAQRNPNLIISKEVQKVSNANATDNTQYLTVASIGYAVWTISKPVLLTADKLDQVVPQGNIVSVGYPVWTISKQVQQKPSKNKDQKKNVFVPESIASW